MWSVGYIKIGNLFLLNPVIINNIDHCSTNNFELNIIFQSIQNKKIAVFVVNLRMEKSKYFIEQRLSVIGKLRGMLPM